MNKNLIKYLMLAFCLLINTTTNHAAETAEEIIEKLDARLANLKNQPFDSRIGSKYQKDYQSLFLYAHDPKNSFKDNALLRKRIAITLGFFLSWTATDSHFLNAAKKQLARYKNVVAELEANRSKNSWIRILTNTLFDEMKSTNPLAVYYYQAINEINISYLLMKKYAMECAPDQLRSKKEAQDEIAKSIAESKRLTDDFFRLVKVENCRGLPSVCAFIHATMNIMKSLERQRAQEGFYQKMIEDENLQSKDNEEEEEKEEWKAIEKLIENPPDIPEEFEDECETQCDSDDSPCLTETREGFFSASLDPLWIGEKETNYTDHRKRARVDSIGNHSLVSIKQDSD